MRDKHSASRRRLLREILSRQRVERQEDLVGILKRSGYAVTQATVSRDLGAIGAEKRVLRDGRERYVVGDGELSTNQTQSALVGVLQIYLISMVPSNNILVVRTLPAGAAPVAAAIDSAGLNGVLGTVAGDDTVMVVTRNMNGAVPLRKRFDEMLGE